MNKSELAEQVAQQASLSKTDAAAAVDAVFNTISQQLGRGGEVSVAGFGKFSVTERAARQGVHPQSGEPMSIAASKGAKFSASSRLKEIVKS